MYFEVAGIEVSPWIPPLISFAISILTASGGVSGAFLILPFQMSVLNYTSPSVSGTNQVYNIIAIPSGVWRYIKEGRMVWPLTWIVIFGTLPGVFIGAILRVTILVDVQYFKIFAGLVLLYMGSRMVLDLIQKKANNKNSAEERFQELVKEHSRQNKLNKQIGKQELPKVKVLEFNLKRLVYDFYGEKFIVPTIKISIISFIVGIAGGTYGIGGGAIMAPFFVTFFKLPVYTVAGAALMGTFVTSIAAVIFFQLLAPYFPEMSVAPDYLLGLLFGIGGIGGMYIGARLQKYMPAKFIKWLLAVLLMYMSISYISQIYHLF